MEYDSVIAKDLSSDQSDIFDNDPSTIEREKRSISTALNDIDPSLKIIEISSSQTWNTFILTPSSIQFKERISNLFHKDRYEITDEITEVNVDVEFGDDVKMSFMPVKKNTLGIKRNAYKKLKRPIILSIIAYGLLCIAMLFIIACMYIVIF